MLATTKGGTDGHPQEEAERAVPRPRLNNYLSPAQKAAATRRCNARLAWYHGPRYRELGHTGIRLEQCINALPKEKLDQLRTDLFGKFGIVSAIQSSRWSMTELLDYTVTTRSNLYDCRFHRGTFTIEREGRPFAELVLETEDQWAAGLATLNPTGTLDEAPPGVPRILVVCTFGLATGVVLRQKAERALRRMGVDAWLECVGRADAIERVRYADIVLATEDEAEAVGPKAIPIQNHEYETAIVENWVDGSEVRRKLAAALGVPARSRPLPARLMTDDPIPAGLPVAPVPFEAVAGRLSLPGHDEGLGPIR